MQLSTLGLIIILLVSVQTARGPWGLFLAYVFAAIIIAMLLVNYQQFTAILYKGSGGV